jgi:hypothetical protein
MSPDARVLGNGACQSIADRLHGLWEEEGRWVSRSRGRSLTLTTRAYSSAYSSHGFTSHSCRPGHDARSASVSPIRYTSSTPQRYRRLNQATPFQLGRMPAMDAPPYLLPSRPSPHGRRRPQPRSRLHPRPTATIAPQQPAPIARAAMRPILTYVSRPTRPASTAPSSASNASARSAPTATASTAVATRTGCE